MLVADRSVNGGGVNPKSAIKSCFFLRKEKKMLNILKRKNMYSDEKICKIHSFGHVLRFRLIWILVCISKHYKKRVLPYGGGGGAQNLTDRSAINRCFFYAFPNWFSFDIFFIYLLLRIEG